MALLVAGIAVSSLGCRTESSNPGAASDEATEERAVMDELRHFDSSFEHRRAVLEASLVNPDNGYSRLRLAAYRQHRWERLPVARFRTRPVLPADLGKPPPTPDESWTMSGGNEQLPASLDDLRELGQRLFATHPAQVERSMLKVLRSEDGPSRYGLWQTASSVGGLVWVELGGGVYPALTCSSCHSSATTGGKLRPGVPNHGFDLGRAKDDYVGRRSLYSTWGPGRVDIAADGRDNPIVIADVRAVRFQTHLHRTANVKNSLPALAVRVETGLITAHRQKLRPTPVDAFAIAQYLWSLGAELPAPGPSPRATSALFERHCGRCHRGPGLSGEPVAAESVGSPVARMHSAARGTGNLQATSLRGVSDRQRLLFGGDATSFESLLSPDRKTGGHHYGRHLTSPERETLVAYLQGL